MTKKQLELFSFEIDEQSFEDEVIYVMEFPVAWKDYIESKRVDDRNWFKLDVQPTNLGLKLQALYPSIFSILWTMKKRWMLSTQEIHPEQIKAICLHWFAAEEKCLIDELPKEMKEVTLVWRQFKAKGYIENYKDHAVYYNWIPALVAHRFAESPQKIHIAEGFEGDLQLSHVHMNHIHECVSQPIQKDQKSEPFSYVYQFKLENRGTLPEKFILNVFISLRRYVLKPISSANSRYAGTILLGAKNPFFIHSGQTRSFIQLKFKYDWRSKRFTWERNVDELFIDIFNKKIDLNEIMKNPKSYFDDDKYTARIVFNERTFFTQPRVKKGAGFPERSALFDLFRSTFSHLKQLPFQKEISARAGSAIFPVRHQLTEGETIQLEVYGNESLTTELIECLIGESVLTEEVEKNKTYLLNASPALYVNFLTRNPNGIVEPLNIDKYKMKAFDYQVRQIEKQLQGKLETATPKLALIEIEKKEDWKKDTDPKESVRKGLAHCNRLTQFIYPFDEKESSSQRRSRLLNSFYDLLSDYGMLPNKVDKIKLDDAVLAVDLIAVKKGYRSKAYIPVISKLENNELKIKFFDSPDWLHLRDAQIIAASNIVKSISGNDQLKFQSFFHRTVQELLDKTEKNIIILLDANLRYRKWLEVRNSDLNSAELPFLLNNATAKERVRAVRINSLSDVPHYRIENEGRGNINWMSGLFSSDSIIYYSVGGRPDTMLNVAMHMQKFTNPGTLIVKQQPMEIIPIGTQEVVERNELAVMTNLLRRLNIAYKFSTKRPYPFHMFRSIEKYLFEYELAESDGQQNEVQDLVIIEGEKVYS